MKENNLTVCEEAIAILIKLGLTSTQAKIYLSLVTIGKTNAMSLTKFSMISRQDVYQTLNELFEMSLIEKVVSKPTEYQAIPPKACLERLTEQRNKITREINHIAGKVFEQFNKTTGNPNYENAQILLIPKKEPVLLRAQGLIEYAQETIRVITPSQKMIPWIIDETNFFLNALKRNVKIQFITDIPTNSDLWHNTLVPFESSPVFSIRYISNPPFASFGIYDEKKLILELLADGNYLDSETIITENTSMLEMASTYFNLIWDQAIMCLQ